MLKRYSVYLLTFALFVNIPTTALATVASAFPSDISEHLPVTSFVIAVDRRLTTRALKELSHVES